MLQYLIFRFTIGFLGLLPFSLVHRISDLFAIIATYIIPYRRKVIHKNLDIAFPELTKHEKTTLTRKSYQNLFDILLESLRSYTMTPKQIIARFGFPNKDLLDPYLKRNETIVVYAAHIGNWEWGPVVLPMHIEFEVIGLIKPIKNKRIYNFIIKKRAETGVQMVSIYADKKVLTQDFPKPKCIIYIADQNPSNKDRAFEVDFFNQKTVCLHGAEVYAKKHNCSVLYLETQRLKRGRYQFVIHEITNEPQTLPEAEITRQYFNLLEKTIKADPSAWLWTHKRWKHHVSYN